MQAEATKKAAGAKATAKVAALAAGPDADCVRTLTLLTHSHYFRPKEGQVAWIERHSSGPVKFSAVKRTRSDVVRASCICNVEKTFGL